MTSYQELIEVPTSGKGLLAITEAIGKVVAHSGISTGVCVAFVRHTSASLVIQENADPSVLSDLQSWMSDLAPESRPWRHDDEGPDDMPAHARAAVTKTSELIPVTNGKLALGTWQGIFLWEHRRAPHRRQIVVTVMGT